MRAVRVFFYCIIGTVLEWYDFAIFGVLSPVLASIFFPHKDTTTSLLLTLSIFATGFIMRPLGGIVFGHIGDKYGRKKAIIWSMLLMAAATTAIGLLPVVLTPHLIIVFTLLGLRLLQGFSVGGDMPGVMTFISEITPRKHFFFFQGFIHSGIIGGMILGLVIGKGALAAYHGDPTSNAWRIPFLMGAIIGAIGGYLRVKALETPLFFRLQQQQKTAVFPVKMLIKRFPKELTILFFMFNASYVIAYFVVVFYPVYLKQLGLSVNQVLTINLTGLGVLFFSMLLLSLFFTYKNYQKFIIFSLSSFIFLPVPVLWLISHDTMHFALVGEILFDVIFGILEVLIPTAAIIAFPTEVRYSGVALCLGLTAIFGGFSPSICVLLIKLTGIPYAPGFLITLFALCALIAVFISRPMQAFREF